MTVEFERTSYAGTTVETGFKIEQMVKEGWEVDPDNPLTLFGIGALEVGFIRDPANAKDAPPKMTRAEILTKARAQKAANKANEGKETTSE